MATIRPLNGASYSFLDVVNVLIALGERSEALPGDARAFTAVMTDSHPSHLVTYEVSGRGFAYGPEGGGFVSAGVVEGIDILVNGVPLVRVSDLEVAVEDVARAQRAEADGSNPRAVEELILGLDFDYRGTGMGEVALETFTNADGYEFDPAGNDVFDLGEGEAQFFAGGGDDVLIGGDGFDFLDGGPGDDRIEPGLGGDTIIGGAGFDTLVLRGLLGGGFDLIRTDAWGEEAVFALDRADGTYDGILGVERFAGSGQSIPLEDVPAFDALAYGASHDDLAALGADEAALTWHYLTEGFFEGREITFDAEQYLANHPDLAATLDGDAGAAARHHILHGREEECLAADPLDYVASFDDLIAAFGDRSPEGVRLAGLRHYERGGAEAGRGAGIDFDAGAYLANHADLRAAFGADEGAATLHYIAHGHEKGRLAADALLYVASFDDLVRAAEGLDGAEAVRAFAARHYRAHGRDEGRLEGLDFDADAYLANHADLRSAFADGEGGYDEAAATLHYILRGFEADRTDELVFV